MNDGIEICSKVQDREGDRCSMKAEILNIFILTLKPKRKVDVSERMNPENSHGPLLSHNSLGRSIVFIQVSGSCN